MLVEAQSPADLQQQAVVQERQNPSLRERTLKDLEDAVLGRTIQLTARSEQIVFLMRWRHERKSRPGWLWR